MLNRFGITAILMLAAILLSAGASVAQEGDKKVELEVGKWYPKLDFGLVLAQSAYSNNWNGSEQGQVAWNFILNSALTRRFTQKLNWANNLKLAFGHTHNQKFNDATPPARVWDHPEKTTDLIDFESLLRFTLDRWVDPYAAVRVLTQFLDNSDLYDRDLWLSPLTVFGSAGIAREFYRTEDEMFLSRLGAAVRSNTRQFYPEAPGVSDNRETETTHDAGVEWVTDYRIKVLEDKVLWTSKLTVYKPLEYSFHGTMDDVAPELSDYPLAVDLNWENIFTGEIVSWLNVNLYVMFIYDKYDNSIVPMVDDQGNLTDEEADRVRSAVREAGQFKQTLGISLSYKFL
jgi:hypothetical protein